MYHATDGYINPADVTMAMAKGARQRGVEIVRRLQADSFEWTGTHWEVTCSKMIEKRGNLIASDEQVVITAEHVVTASRQSRAAHGEDARHQDPSDPCGAPVYCH
ncbi:aminomethyl transferase family protein [Rhodobacteraceae bacterium HTCC2083]|nr:aminomethyl transferase family protein [Rhodobacteraceae bacterium HTCC2083]